MTGRYGSDAKVAEIIRKVDADGNGKLDEEEFVRMVRARLDCAVPPLQRWAAMKADGRAQPKNSPLSRPPAPTGARANGVTARGAARAASKKRV